MLVERLRPFPGQALTRRARDVAGDAHANGADRLHAVTPVAQGKSKTSGANRRSNPTPTNTWVSFRRKSTPCSTLQFEFDLGLLNQ